MVKIAKLILYVISYIYMCDLCNIVIDQRVNKAVKH